MDAALGDEQHAAPVQIGGGHVHDQQAVVPPDHGAEQQRALPVDLEFPVGEIAGALVIKPLLGQGALPVGVGLEDVAVAVEDTEGIALLEHAGGLLGFRTGGDDVPLVVGGLGVGHGKSSRESKLGESVPRPHSPPLPPCTALGLGLAPAAARSTTPDALAALRGCASCS
jgi:hypothetical protein